MKTIRENNKSIRPLFGLQSLLLVLQLCALVCFQYQREVIVVESWSQRALPLSPISHRSVALSDQTNFHAQRRSTFFPMPSALAAGSSGDQESDDEEPQFIEVESLSASQVTELIELSFFQACFALSKGDVEPLKLFIVAVVTATKKHKGASATALAMTVDALPPSMRPLEPQERDLRETWIKAVYLMMGHVLEGFDNGSNEDDEVTKTYGPILVDLLAIHRTGMGLNVNQFVASRKDILLPKTNVLVLEDGPEDDDLVQLSVVTQTINVLYTTLVVLDEEYESSGPSDVDEEELKPAETVEATSPAKKGKKKKGKNTSSGGRGFG